MSNIKKQIAKLPPVFWLIFYIFVLLITLPVLAYIGVISEGAPDDPPAVTTLTSSEVTENSVNLKGAVDPDGEITERGFEYGETTSYGLTQIDETSLSSYEYDGNFGPDNSTNFRFEGNSDTAFDSLGNMYVTDTNNHRIQKFDSDSNFVSSWGSHGKADGNFRSPLGISVDTSDNIYVVDTQNNRIQKFDSSGNYLLQWGGYGSGDGQFLAPYDISVDTSDNIYVVDTQNNRIQKFDSSG
ncbi:6-bladed beta-propeller, partial [Candidatus Saccharibacteria bacterium]|nr:6-bladed beta-propeller [Candidatus Saccharibacteria bacterium]